MPNSIIYFLHKPFAVSLLTANGFYQDNNKIVLP